MDLDKIKKILSQINLSITHPMFYSRVFSAIAKLRKEDDRIEHKKRICTEEYDDLSRRIDRTQIQDSCSVRNVLRTRRLANFLIQDDGEVNLLRLTELIECCEKKLYSLGPNRQYDSVRHEYLLSVLKNVKANPTLVILLKNISKPYAHPYAEEVIRETLQLPSRIPITDAHARRAAFSALICYLRQSVGSCFGTAPAIVIHDEQPEQFLKDINDLFGTGRLKRTFGGIEYSVPLSHSWGAGDLRQPLLFQKDAHETFNEIWLSPGLIAAFEAAELLNSKDSVQEKVKNLKAIILKVFSELDQRYSVITINPETLIRKALLLHLHLIENDLNEFEKRSKLNVTFFSQSTGSNKKEHVYLRFLQLFAKAKNAFLALADNALLKSWEFTIASFAETKEGFTNWNLYTSLGFEANQKGGVGERLYAIVQSKLEECNEKVREFQDEYEMVYGQVKYLESRLRNASEKEASWIKAEYQSKANEFYTLEELRNKLHAKASRFASLYKEMVEKYLSLFPSYFQEVYDANMHEVNIGLYNDSPAGFRLLYKYGRGNSSQWTLIYNRQEFIDSLVSFFTSTESELNTDLETEGIESEVSEIITAIVTHLRSDEFLETALYRLATIHKTSLIKDPLDHLDKVEKKPWAYVSGGTMDNLISCYYRREQKPSFVGRWVESPMELLVFLVDTVKQIPYKIMEDFIHNSKKSMLMQSPTHAFLFKPGDFPFNQLWQTESFTYTWVRDHFVRPMQTFVDMIFLDESMMMYLIERVAEKIPVHFRKHFEFIFSHIYGTMSPIEFRKHLIEGMSGDRGFSIKGRLVISKDEIDHLLFTSLPLTPADQLRRNVEDILNEMSIENFDKKHFSFLLDLLFENDNMQSFIEAKQLQDLCKAIICLITFETTSSIDYHKEVALAAQKLGFAMPKPIKFADTNWVRDDFAFTINPGTGHLELWRIDSLGTTGYPMSMWVEWLNGTRRDISWGVFNRPYEYTPGV